MVTKVSSEHNVGCDNIKPMHRWWSKVRNFSDITGNVQNETCFRKERFAVLASW